MPECPVCGKVFVGSDCAFCKERKGIDDERPSLKKLGWDDSEDMIYDPKKHPQTKIEVQGTYIEGDVKIIKGDVLGQNAKKIEATDSVIISKSKTEKGDPKLRTCQHCNKQFEFPELPKICPYCEKQILK